MWNWLTCFFFSSARRETQRELYSCAYTWIQDCLNRWLILEKRCRLDAQTLQCLETDFFVLLQVPNNINQEVPCTKRYRVILGKLTEAITGLGIFYGSHGMYVHCCMQDTEKELLLATMRNRSLQPVNCQKEKKNTPRIPFKLLKSIAVFAKCLPRGLFAPPFLSSSSSSEIQETSLFFVTKEALGHKFISGLANKSNLTLPAQFLCREIEIYSPSSLYIYEPSGLLVGQARISYSTRRCTVTLCICSLHILFLMSYFCTYNSYMFVLCSRGWTL